MYLDNLPKTWKGINWSNAIGFIINFQFDDIQDTLQIIGYEPKTHNLLIKYGHTINKINTGSLLKCKLSKVLKKVTSDFKLKINENIVNKKDNLIIINREKRITNNKRYKWYRYKCNICNWDNGWIEETNLFKGRGCSCCSGTTVVEGINDISATEPWMIKYFQGGYNEAKLYTKGSDKLIFPICPDCGKIKDKPYKISNIFHMHSIGCSCSDNISYPEKYVISILNQLNINYIYQLNKRYFEWCKNFKYDFYLTDYNCIIETNGEQHYTRTFKNNKITLQEQLDNDFIKEKLALGNNIRNYIILDCRHSRNEWIKNKIINSKLSNILDLTLIKWDQCDEYAMSNLVKKVCNIKKENPQYTPNDISKITKLSRSTVYKYLKQGSKLEWCNYDPQYESKMSGKITYAKTRSIHEINVGIYKNNKLLYMFNSYSELEKQSFKLFGVKLLRKYISNVCNGERTDYKGYIFKKH